AEAAGRGGEAARARDAALLEMLYATGLRVSELTGLSLDDVDLSGRSVRVLGKGGKERIVPFGGPAEKALRRWLALGAPVRAEASRRQVATEGGRPEAGRRRRSRGSGSSTSGTPGSTAGTAGREAPIRTSPARSPAGSPDPLAVFLNLRGGRLTD